MSASELATPVAMTRSRPIISDQPIEDVWKLLRLMRDTVSVAARIRQLHKIPDGKHEADVRKQAVQLAQSLRQAEEYFRAARLVTLATRPTLLYYGATSLSRALILLRQDGSHSYDALRVSERHNHHGLDVGKRFLTVSADASAQDIFRSIASEIHVHRTEGVPWGNFSLFYDSLIAPAVIIRHTIVESGRATSTTKDETQPTVDLGPIADLVGRTLDLLTLIQQMPDLWLHIIDLTLEPTVCPGHTELKSLVTPAGSDGGEGPARVQQEWDFFVYAATALQREQLKELVAESEGMSILNETETSLALRLTREFSGDAMPRVYVPDAVDSLTGRMFFVPNPEAYIVEPAAQLAILYSLSMLARYYPDKWMAFIERNVLVAELLDTVLNVIERKFPLLVLDQLTGIKHYVQTQ
jgi:hypothetical protein